MEPRYICFAIWAVLQLTYVAFLAGMVRRSEQRWPLWVVAAVVATVPPTVTWPILLVGGPAEALTFVACANPVALAASLLVLGLPPFGGPRWRSALGRSSGVVAWGLTIYTVFATLPDR